MPAAMLQYGGDLDVGLVVCFLVTGVDRVTVDNHVQDADGDVGRHHTESQAYQRSHATERHVTKDSHRRERVLDDSWDPPASDVRG